MDIYIKSKKKATLSGVSEITLGDVAEIVADTGITDKISKLVLQKITADNKTKKNYLISVTDIIKAIKEKFPDATVSNVGETDTWVQFSAQKSRDTSWWKWAKIAFVCLVLTVGSSTAIMAFHTDSQIPRIFENYYRLLTGNEQENPRVVTIPYAIGLAVGIIAFYNHFMGRKLTDDPTPIEVEMEQYENHVTETMVDLMKIRKRDKQGKATDSLNTRENAKEEKENTKEEKENTKEEKK